MNAPMAPPVSLHLSGDPYSYTIYTVAKGSDTTQTGPALGIPAPTSGSLSTKGSTPGA